MRKPLVKLSKLLSLVLRHDPSAIGVTLDESGWIDIGHLLTALQRKEASFSREVLDEIVATNDKKRFILSEDGGRIRAAQGHSIGIQLGLDPKSPPSELYHGTAERNLPSIREKGLVRGQRDHVHLSPDIQTAESVGRRHGKEVVLVIRATLLAESGHAFYLSENGVWLTHEVPVAFIQFPVGL